MEARIHAITLGVSDLASSRKFYEAMGWKASSSSNENAVFYCKGALLALFPEKKSWQKTPRLILQEQVFAESLSPTRL